MEGLLLLRDAVGRERRPLGLRLGPQTVRRPPLPVMRDAKRAEHRRLTILRPPDEV
jgi:NADH-quinone oxidoreductase subunit B